jgi:hypothetical protein
MGLVQLSRLQAAVPEAGSDTTGLTQAGEAASDAVEKWCRRKFAAADYDLAVDGPHGPHLILPQRPVNSVAAVRAGLYTALYVQNTDGTAYMASVTVGATGLTLTKGNAGVPASTTLLYSTYPTVAALAAAITGLGGGWLGTAGGDPLGNWPSSDLAFIPATFGCRQTQANLNVFYWYLDAYRVESESGQLYRMQGWPRGTRNVRVSYNAGYSTIPDAIQQAVSEVTRAAYLSFRLDPNMQSESLGGYSYTVAAEKGLQAMSGATRANLAGYRDLALGAWR